MSAQTSRRETTMPVQYYDIIPIVKVFRGGGMSTLTVRSRFQNTQSHDLLSYYSRRMWIFKGPLRTMYYGP